MDNNEPITPTTVRPLRVLGAIAAGGVLLVVFIAAIHEGSYRYQLWRAGGVWCATLEPDGTVTKEISRKEITLKLGE